MLALVGVFGAILAPWWIPVACMVLLSVRFRAWEVPFIGLLIDLLWRAPSSFHTLPLFTILGVVLVWIFEPMRTQFLFDR